MVVECDVPGGSVEVGLGNFEVKESAIQQVKDQGTSGSKRKSKRKRAGRSDAVEAKTKKERRGSGGKKNLVCSKDPESEELVCAVCCETLAQSSKNSNRSIQCPLCQYQACAACVERYILHMREGQPQCMNPDCQAEWHTSFLSEHFPKSWIHGPYFKVRSEFSLKMEMAKLPEDQESLLNYRHSVQLKKDVEELDKEAKELKRQLDEKRQIMSFTKNMISEYKRSEYLVNLRNVEPEVVSSNHGQLPCQDEECKGFLNKDTHMCNTCDRITCKMCHILLGKESEDVTVNHVCKKEDIETAKLLKENTKPCPSCNMGVYKIEGCSQMFCTSCKTAFGWTTGKIITRNIHNPHYFEWRREQEEGGDIPRQPEDQPREGVEELQRNLFHRYNVRRLSKGDLWKRLGCLEHSTHGAGVDTPKAERAHIGDAMTKKWVDNMESVLLFVKRLMSEVRDVEYYERPDACRVHRLHYANNNTTEVAFKNELIKGDKKQSKSNEIKDVIVETARHIVAQLSNVTGSLESMQAVWDEVQRETKQLDQKLASIRKCFGGSVPCNGRFSQTWRALGFAKRLQREDGYPSMEADGRIDADLGYLYHIW